MGLLAFIILCPLVTALAIACLPRTLRVLFRSMAVLATFFSMVVAAVVFFRSCPGTPGFQFEVIIPWVHSLGISWHLGVDGLNAGLILMASIVAFASVCVSYEIQEREKEYYILLLMMSGGIIGAFASLDLFFFYFFHEFALVPTFIMIGVWGRGDRRDYAAFKMTIYLSLGALIALLGLVGLYLQTGARSFDIPDMLQQVRLAPISTGAQNVIFPLLMFGFGILVSLWPFHTWAPIGYASAPTAAAMMHAGVIKKFGLYGLIRVALPLLPAGAQGWLNILALLCLGNILYCGLVALRQKDLNWLLGNSSVAHMGFAFLGIASLSLAGVTGAVLIMVAHGLSSALGFALSGYLQKHAGTANLEQMGGLLQKLPFIGTVLAMGFMASCGLPGFANFPGELMVFFGTWKSYPVLTVLAVWGGLVLGAVYMLRAIRAILHGPVPERLAKTADATNLWRKLPFVCLLGALLLFGFWPKLLTDRVGPVVTQIVADATKTQNLTPAVQAGLTPPAAPLAATAPNRTSP